MKKLVAVLLSLSMLTALAGCSKKTEETSKTSKTKKTKDTEITETEKPEESETTTTTTTEATETSDKTSEDTSDTQPGRDLTPSNRPKDYPVANGFKIHEDAENLQFKLISNPRAFAKANPDDPSAPAQCIFKNVEMFDFFPNTVEGYEQLWNSVQATGENLDAQYNDAYDKTLPNFVSGKSAFSGDYCMESNTYIYRADSDYFSYYMTQCYQDGTVSADSIKTFNYRTFDGCPLNINDIVTNRAACADFLEDYVGNSEAYDYEKDYAKKIANQLRDENQEVEFLLGYDALYLVTAEDNSFFAEIIKIPAMYGGDFLDLSYFGSTPKYYSLSSDVYDRITWDLDGDSKLDEIYPEFEKDEYGNIINMNLVLNGSIKSAVPSGEIVEADSGLYFVGMKLMKTDSGFFAYLELSPEEADSYVYVLHFNGKSFDYTGYFIGNIGSDNSCYDPDNFKVGTSTDLFGTGFVSYTCSVIDNNGLPRIVDAFGDRGGIAIAKMDIICNEIDKEGHQIGMFTIKTDTPCYCTGLDLEGKRIHLLTLNEDESQNKEIELFASDEGYRLVLGSKDQNEAFYGLRYAG